jgi:CRP/FNR family cyclic AMP-dependent transcriptional regulator
MRLNELSFTAESQVVFKPGQTLFKEGEPGDFMYVLLEGTVEVQVQQKVVGAFEAVEAFGEMAVIDPSPRSATVVATTNCKLARINNGRFVSMVRNRPEFALHIMSMMVERIRWMDSAAATSASEHAQAVEKLRETARELRATIEAQKEQIEGSEQTFQDNSPTMLAVT